MSLVNHTVSQKKVAANQSNAAHSTGPVTQEGKKRSRANALKQCDELGDLRYELLRPERFREIAWRRGYERVA